eukprot:scaffold1996_cov132-Isochrysis_galbana.AAC.14
MGSVKCRMFRSHKETQMTAITCWGGVQRTGTRKLGGGWRGTRQTGERLCAAEINDSAVVVLGRAAHIKRTRGQSRARKCGTLRKRPDARPPKWARSPTTEAALARARRGRHGWLHLEGRGGRLCSGHLRADLANLGAGGGAGDQRGGRAVGDRRAREEHVAPRLDLSSLFGNHACLLHHRRRLARENGLVEPERGGAERHEPSISWDAHPGRDADQVSRHQLRR